MNRSGLCSLSLAALLPGCIAVHSLGDTAEASSGGDPPISTHEGSASTDGGLSGDETTVPGDSSSTGEPPDPETDSSGTGAAPGCEPGIDVVVLAEPRFPDAIPGIEASFVAILEGDCDVGVPRRGGGDPALLSLPLACALSGRVDGDGELVDQPFSPVLEILSHPEPSVLLGSLGETARLRLVLDWWGMGWNRWLVLERDEGTLVLDLIDAEYLDPTDSSWGPEVEALIGVPWHGALDLDVGASACGDRPGECGAEPRALSISWSGVGGIALHDQQQGSVGTPIEELMYQAWVEVAAEVPTPQCTDHPLATFQAALWAMQP